MADDAPFLPGLSPVAGKPVQVTFDAGRLSSDGGVLGAGRDRASARDRRASGALPRGSSSHVAPLRHHARSTPAPPSLGAGPPRGRAQVRHPALDRGHGAEQQRLSAERPSARERHQHQPLDEHCAGIVNNCHASVRLQPTSDIENSGTRCSSEQAASSGSSTKKS